jgi:MFS family permease
MVGAIVLVDMAFYAAITPLLPVYADRFELSKTGAGILAGAYAAGALLGSFPSGWLATRAGSRRTVLVGLVLMSLASVGFAFGESVVALDAMRFVQGIGGACTWAGGLGWLLTVTAAEDRGKTIGTVLSAALVGLLIGPALGALARAIGDEVPFCAVGVLGLVLIGSALRTPAPPLAPVRRRPLATSIGDGRVVAGMVLVTVSAIVFGTIEVLAPLRLDRLGAGGAVIAATFLIAAAVEAIGQYVAGHATDRVGRELPVLLALAGTIAFLLVLPLPQTVALLAVLLTVGCTAVGVINTPAMTLISDGVAEVGVDQGFGFSLVNLTWATGQVAGTMAGGALAGATSDTVPYLLLAAVCALTLWVLVRGRLSLGAASGATGEPAPASVPAGSGPA